MGSVPLTKTAYLHARAGGHPQGRGERSSNQDRTCYRITSTDCCHPEESFPRRTTRDLEVGPTPLLSIAPHPTRFLSADRNHYGLTKATLRGRKWRRSLVIPALSRNPGAGDVDSRPVSGYGAGSARERRRGGAAGYFHSNWPCRLRPTPWKMKMVAAFGGSEDEGGDARAPSLGPRSPIGVGDRLRGDDGWWAGVTILVRQAAPGAIFRGMTLGRSVGLSCQ